MMSEARATRKGDVRLAYLRNRYAILFYTLLLTTVAVPLFAAFELMGGDGPVDGATVVAIVP